MPSAKINEVTPCEWRELGFFYDRDDSANEWWIAGSTENLSHFVEILRGYAAYARHEVISVHQHDGPYMYPEISIRTTSETTDHWIAGLINNLLELTAVVK